MVNSIFNDIRNKSWKYYRYKNKKKYYKLIINNENNNLDMQAAKIKNQSKLKEIVAVLPFNPQYSHWKVELIDHMVKCLSTTSTNKQIFPKSRFKLIFSNCGPTLGQIVYPKPLHNDNQDNDFRKSYVTVQSLKKRTKTSYFANVEMNEKFVYKNFNENGRIKRFNQLFKSRDCDLESNIITNSYSNDKCDWRYNLCLGNVACNTRDCKHHKKFLIFGNKFKCKYSGVTINIKQNFNCNTCNVIYAITCLKCAKTGIGSTEMSIKNRINHHIWNIMNEKIGCMVVKHFNECCYETVNGVKDPLFYFSFKIIAKIPRHRNILQNMHALWKQGTYYQKLLYTTEY